MFGVMILRNKRSIISANLAIFTPVYITVPQSIVIISTCNHFRNHIPVIIDKQAILVLKHIINSRMFPPPTVSPKRTAFSKTVNAAPATFVYPI